MITHVNYYIRQLSACGESLKEPAKYKKIKIQQKLKNKNNETEATELQLILLYNFYSFILSAAA